MLEDRNLFIKTEFIKKLRDRPKKLIELDQWLYVSINTARSIIDNTDKSQFDHLKKFTKCETSRDVQQLFDEIQGKFGNKNFSKRHDPNYLYLCSLVANFSKMKLSSNDQRIISSFIVDDKYLLYEI